MLLCDSECNACIMQAVTMTTNDKHHEKVDFFLRNFWGENNTHAQEKKKVIKQTP